MFGVVSVSNGSVVVGRHVWVQTNVQTKEWRMINFSMTHVVLFLVVHGLSEVLMSKRFSKWHRVCHHGCLNSNIMNRCYISRRCDNWGDMSHRSNVRGSSDVTQRSSRSNLSDGILREKRTFVIREVLSDVTSESRCDFDDRLLVFVERSERIIDRLSDGSESCNNESSHDVVLNYYNRLTYVSLN